MEWIVIEGVRPYDGRYEFDLGDELTTREWSWVKKHSGYMPLTVNAGLEGGDPELFAVFAAIALRRAGRLEIADVPAFIERLQDVGFGSRISFEVGDEEADASPPPAGTNSNADTSGDASQTSSGSQGNGQSPTGTPASASSALPQPW